jgi:hypothetical protein
MDSKKIYIQLNLQQATDRCKDSFLRHLNDCLKHLLRLFKSFQCFWTLLSISAKVFIFLFFRFLLNVSAIDENIIYLLSTELIRKQLFLFIFCWRKEEKNLSFAIMNILRNKQAIYILQKGIKTAFCVYVRKSQNFLFYKKIFSSLTFTNKMFQSFF